MLWRKTPKAQKQKHLQNQPFLQSSDIIWYIFTLYQRHITSHVYRHKKSTFRRLTRICRCGRGVARRRGRGDVVETPLYAY